MPEAPEKAAETAEMLELAREVDRDRVKRIASFHLVIAMGALTLWGAAATWAQVTDWGVAHAAALANAIIAGFVLPSVVHEWGHFAGARLAGAVSPVFDEPRRHFFIFDFPMDQNDTRQFGWMSWGGILAPWLPVFLVACFVPLGFGSAALLLATLVFKAVSTAAFEVPVVLRVGRGGEPGAELARQVAAGALPRSRRIGAAVGTACLALLWIAG